MFNEKLAKALTAHNPNHNVQLSQMDLDAEREGMAIRNSSRPTFKGKRLLNKAPSRFTLRG